MGADDVDWDALVRVAAGEEFDARLRMESLGRVNSSVGTYEERRELAASYEEAKARHADAVRSLEAARKGRESEMGADDGMDGPEMQASDIQEAEKTGGSCGLATAECTTIAERCRQMESRALAAEHSVGVLTAQLEAERQERDTVWGELQRTLLRVAQMQAGGEVETIWDRDARAVLGGLSMRGVPVEWSPDKVDEACTLIATRMANRMEAQRKVRREEREGV